MSYNTHIRSALVCHMSYTAPSAAVATGLDCSSRILSSTVDISSFSWLMVTLRDTVSSVMNPRRISKWYGSRSVCVSVCVCVYVCYQASCYISGIYVENIKLIMVFSRYALLATMAS